MDGKKLFFMIKNDDGLIAVRHYNSNPATIQAGESMYSFVPQYGVSLGWIKEEDLGKVFTIKTAACCGKSQLKFSLANQNDVSVWREGHY